MSAEAQGPEPARKRRRASVRDFYYTVGGTLLEADPAEGFVILDLRADKPVRFPLDDRFAMSADKRTRLHGVKDLSLEDSRRGDPVQVSFSTSDGRAIRLKLQKLPK